MKKGFVKIFKAIIDVAYAGPGTNKVSKVALLTKCLPTLANVMLRISFVTAMFRYCGGFANIDCPIQHAEIN